MLEIHVHLINGTTRQFTQSDPSVVERLLEQFSPRLFSQPILVFHDQERAVSFPGAALTGISLIMDRVPPRLRQPQVQGPDATVTFREISLEDYQAKLREPLRIVEGQPITLVTEIELTSRQRFWLETHSARAVSGIAERQILHHLFAAPGLLCDRLGGGVTLWNRAQFVSYSLYPLPEVPSSAWAVDSTEPAS